MIQDLEKSNEKLKDSLESSDILRAKLNSELNDMIMKNNELRKELDISTVERNKIEIVPMAFMRGRTFNDAYIIGDEMQNSTPMQMKTLLTRVGRNSKLIITGDLGQSDLPYRNGLSDIISLLSRKYKYDTENMYRDGIGIVKFDTSGVQRNPIVKHILEIYDKSNSI